MNQRTALIIFTISIWVISTCNTALGIVDIRAIERVREKSILNDSDLRAIDVFVADAVEEVLRAQDKDFATIAKTRSILISRQKSSVANQKQYTQQFTESAQKYMTVALRDAQTLPQARCAKVRINLFIMAQTLNQEALVAMALPYLSDSSKPVSYWATRLATCDAALTMINTSSAQSGQLISALSKIAPSASPETLGLIIPFAAQINTATGQEMILTIAGTRIKLYENNAVTDELADIKVLSGLCVQFNADGPNKTQCAQHFALLFSYAIQRYTKGQAQLTVRQKNNLISIIVETEEKCITTLTNQPQSTLKRAIERDDMDALMAEHGRLLGSATEQGVLPNLLHFSHKIGNSEQNYPPVLNVK